MGGGLPEDKGRRCLAPGEPVKELENNSGKMESLLPNKHLRRPFFREILHSYEEFKARVDREKPIHHRAFRKTFGDGFYSRLVFRIYGLDKNTGQIIIFEARWLGLAMDFDGQRRQYDRLVKNYAKPLGSTEGAWTK